MKYSSKINYTIIIFFVLFFSFSFFIYTKPFPFQRIAQFPKLQTQKNNIATKEGVELSRYLFYDPIMSKDSSLSCI